MSMNREFLFRGQLRRYGVFGEWVYGGLFPGEGDHSIIYGWESLGDQHGYNIQKIPVYSDTVGQYTGLNDKNGTKIFEGDICDFIVYDRVGNAIPQRGVVWYTGSRFTLADSKVFRHIPGYDLDSIHAQPGSELKVIGNIYDNPELL